MKNITYVVGFVWVLVACHAGLASDPCNQCRANAVGGDKSGVLQCLVNQLKNEKSDSAKAEVTIRCTIDLWKTKDGAVGPAISDAFLDVMKINPRVFFNVMVQNDSIFSDWLNNLGTLSFTWYKDPPSPLEQKRENLIQLLKSMGPMAGKQGDFRQSLLVTRENIRPRQVE